MKIKNNQEKSKPTDAKREFYSVIEEIKDLYKNQGYLKQKSLYEKMKEKYKWKMTYQSFSNYFNKEIKNQNYHPTSQAENLNSKKNEIIENSSQNINQAKKEQCNEKDNISTVEQPEISSDVYARYKKELANDVLGESIKNKEEIRKLLEKKEK